MRQTHWGAAVILALLSGLMSAGRVAAQESTPLLGGIIKIPGYSGQPVAPLSTGSGLPAMTPNGAPGWFSRWNYSNFQLLPFTQVNTYKPTYVPIHHRRRVRYYLDEE